MRCTKCGSENREGRKFCSKCGVPLARPCPKCGAPNEPGEDFCGDCGVSLVPASAASTGPTRATEPAIRIASGASSGSPDGERKTVTALFADIKGSTELEQDLDPEEARAIVDPALKLMIEAVRRYDGYIVQSTGDGIFALFGAPVAHEDHPQRALLAAVRMQDEIRRYADRLRAEGRAPLQIRVGANTGEVVVRVIRTGEAKSEYTPIGHTANLAARMQTLANPGATVIAESTRRLVEGYFVLRPLGSSRVKGVAEPVNVYEVTGLGPLRTRLQRAAGRGLTKFVGREREMEALERALEQARAGHGQIVAAMAEAGTGKSRLFFEFKAKNQSGWMVLEALSVSHGKASAYLPVIELLHGYFDIDIGDDARKRREKVAGKVAILDRALEDALPYLFGLLGIVEGEGLLAGIDGQVKRRRTLDAIKRILLRESLNQPLMLMFEDLHWIDEETQALLNLLADSIGTAKVLLLVNYRPEYQHKWGGKTYYTQLRLDPLERESADAMLQSLIGDAPDLVPLKRLIIHKTEGNPLFMEEIYLSLVEDGALVRNGATHLTRPLDALKIPATVQAILVSRIDRLPAAEKDLLQTLAVIGKEFPLALARQVVQKPDDEMDQMLNDLQLAEFIYEQPAAGNIEFTFKHALTHEVAYNSVLLERRKSLHERSGQTLESMFAQHLGDHLGELAHHYSRSGNLMKAIDYLRRAGEQSTTRSAFREATAQLDRALELVGKLPPGSDRDSLELSVRLALVGALLAATLLSDDKSRANLKAARALCNKIGDRRESSLVLSGLIRTCLTSGDLRAASALADELRALVEGNPDESLTLRGCYADVIETWMGRFRPARDQLERKLHLNPELVIGMINEDALHIGTIHLIWVYWITGYPERALQAEYRMLALLSRPVNVLTRASSLQCQLAFHCHFLRDYRGMRDCANSLIAFCRENAVSVFLELGLLRLGRIEVEEGGVGGIDTMLEGMGRLRDAMVYDYCCCVLVEAYLTARRTKEGLTVVEEAIQRSVAREQRLCEAEMLRLKGELLLLSGVSDDAEKSMREAITIAQRQEAKSWELRAATSLARLLRDTGRRDEARAVLAEIYNWFTEGFDTADLKDAKALLDELSA